MSRSKILFLDGAPPIRIQITSGVYTISPRGTLILNISATLRLQCLFPLSKGQPIWEVSTMYRKYPRNWAKIDFRNETETDAYEVCVTTLFSTLRRAFEQEIKNVT